MPPTNPEVPFIPELPQRPDVRVVWVSSLHPTTDRQGQALDAFANYMSQKWDWSQYPPLQDFTYHQNGWIVLLHTAAYNRHSYTWGFHFGIYERSANAFWWKWPTEGRTVALNLYTSLTSDQIDLYSFVK